jgi:tetratricopeptide (TPR) repeat protein
LQALAKTAKFDELGPVSLHSLGAALHSDGDDALAESVLRRAQQRHPRDVWVNSELGGVLQELGRTDEAIRFYTAARAIRPETAHALAHALADRGDFDEAIAVFCDLVALRPKQIQQMGCLRWTLEQRGQSLKDVAADIDRAVAPLREAVRLKPDDAEAHTILGRTLFMQGKYDEAVAEIRAVKRLEPNRRMDWAIWMGAIGTPIGPPRPDGTRMFKHRMTYSPGIRTPDEALSELGALQANALRDQGKLDEAIAAYLEVIQLRPDYAEVYWNLAGTLKRKGDYAGALEMYRKGHELGSQRRGGWEYSSAQWVAQTERELALAPRLPAVLRGEDKPADNAERLDFADMANDRNHVVAASRLWAEAFEADPGLANDLGAGRRYGAACISALAAAGQGEDAAHLDDKERARLRQQALDWLRADLALRSRQLETGPTADPAAAQQALRHWQEDPDLADIRDEVALAKLPAEDRAACENLWANVAGLLKQAKDQVQQLSQADDLAVGSQFLLEEKKWAEAEPQIRQCLAIREKMRPDAWNTFNAQSMLGGALLGQKKYAEAEPLLLAGYEGMKQREKSIPPQGKIRLPQAVERLVQLYEALDKKDEVARWTKEREAIEAPAKKAKEQERMQLEASAAADVLKLAALQAWSGQDKELADTCRRGLESAKNTTVAETADRVAKACCVRPSTEKAQLEEVLALARKAVQLGKDSQLLPWFQMALGMAEYRSGHFAEADAALIAAAKGDEDNPHVAGTSALYRAMSLFRQGKEDEARKLATAAAATMKPLPKDDKNPLAGNASPDDLILWMAYKEAKALIKFEPAPAAPEPPSGK